MQAMLCNSSDNVKRLAHWPVEGTKQRGVAFFIKLQPRSVTVALNESHPHTNRISDTWLASRAVAVCCAVSLS